MKKKALCLLLSALMVFAVLPSQIFAAADSISVTISYQADNTGFVIARQDCMIEPGLAASYGYTYGANTGTDEVTVLDAIVAAHILVYGSDKSDVNDAFVMDTNGWVSNFMDTGAGDFVYLVNSESGEVSSGEMVLSDGDLVELVVVQVDWADTYTWFEYNGQKVEQLTVSTGVPFELTLRGIYAIAYGIWGAVEVIADGAGIVPVALTDTGDYYNAVFGEPLAVTDEDGNAELTFAEPGTYILSAVDVESNVGSPLMSPWLTLTVSDGGGTEMPDPDDLAAARSVIGLINALPAASRLMLSDRSAVQAARYAYNALTTAQKALVGSTVLKRLANAESKLTELENAPVSIGLPTVAELRAVLDMTAAYQLGKITNPSFDSEWAAVGLSRGGYITKGFKDAYLANLETYIMDKNGVIDPTGGKYTEYSRVVLALASLGEDPQDYAGYNLLLPLAEQNNAVRQGTNGTAYALLALNARGYDIPALTSGSANAQTTHEGLIAHLLSTRIKDGGWAANASDPSSVPDRTAMAIQALVPYYTSDSAVKTAVDGALAWLSSAQSTSGGYGTSEYDAQVIIALNELGISLGDASFIKNGKTLYDSLMTYYISASGAFKHLSSSSANAVATEQAMCALVSLCRAMTGVNSLYDMTDANGDTAMSAADKTALYLAISQTDALNSANYTASSWSAFQTALTAARSIAAKTDAAQDEVDSARSELISARNNLVPTGGSNGTTSDITVTFKLTGDTKHGESGAHKPQTWLAKRSVTLPSGSTVKDLTDMELNGADIAFEVRSNGAYIARVQIPGSKPAEYLGEMDNGPDSGWMYQVNSAVPVSTGYADRVLKKGDSVEWFYTDDYTKETGYEGGGTWSNSSGGKEENKADSTQTTTVVIKPTVDTDGKSAAAVKTEDVKTALQNTLKAVDAAKAEGKANAAGEIRLDIRASAVGNVTSSELKIPAEALKAIAEAKNVLLTIASETAVFTLDSAVLAGLIEGVSVSETVKISAAMVDTSEALNRNQQKTAGDNPVTELSITIGDKAVQSFNGTITVRLPYTPPTEETDLELATVYHLGEDGNVSEMKGSRYDAESESIVFTTEHFSIFMISEWINPYTDISKNDWFYKAVRFNYGESLMNGAGDGAFMPGGTLTRAMLMTILYRHEGQPAVTDNNPFTDAENGQWYTDAVIWANANGFAEGYGGGLFGQNDNITREQMALVLMRYAEKKGLDVSKASDISAYSDATAIAPWALDSVSWANAEGLLSGRTEDTLAPKETATRAEAAEILLRFITTLK